MTQALEKVTQDNDDSSSDESDIDNSDGEEEGRASKRRKKDRKRKAKVEKAVVEKVPALSTSRTNATAKKKQVPPARTRGDPPMADSPGMHELRNGNCVLTIFSANGTCFK